MNKALALISSNNKGHGDRKKEKHTEFGVLSLKVEPKRFTDKIYLLDIQYTFDE
ncbi:MAG: hypothetical protein H0V01_10825 [Bacteroidetes bacterium]|nr:hypothetical protein [Bacteroidota bacterium]HET6244226.1 hypothetical protein [Bacteroidia bacterium]